MTTRLPDGKLFEVFFDGDCPLCVREIRMLTRLDRKHARLVFTDIASADFAVAGLPSHAELMREIHGRGADGQLVVGVEVFRQLYAAVGFGLLVRLTRLPGITQLLDLGYRLFAKNRLRLTGRCTPTSCELPAPKP